MEVRLVVASGKHAGQAVPVKRQRFFIGRAEDCHLRPNTDLISRHHCVITIEDGFVSIRDLGSRNGTFVNGQRIRGEEEINNGDKIAVGPMKFEVEFVEEAAKPKEPEAVEEAAKHEEPEAEHIRKTVERTTKFSRDGPRDNADEIDLSDWLGGDADAVHDTRAADQTLTGTASFGTDEDASPTKSTPAAEAEKEPAAEDGEKKTRKDAAKKPGRLPSDIKKPKTTDSQSAAADTLRNFFHRR